VPEGIKKVRTAVPDDRADIKPDRSGRTIGYRVPSLDDCRRMFEEQLGSKLDWDSRVSDLDDPGDLDADVVDMDDLDDYDPLDERRG